MVIEHDLSQLIKELGKEIIDEVVFPEVVKVITDGVVAIEDYVKPYPDEPDRMRSGHLNTYVRGVGHYPARYFVNGVYQGRAAGGRGRVRRTSERLGARWTHEVKHIENTVQATIGNQASYAKRVQAKRVGNEGQAYFHKLTGWTTVDDAIERARPEIDRAFDQMVDELVKWFKGGKHG